MIASEHRPTVIEVNLGAISYNVNQVKQTLPPKTAIFAVVKANAYGHGSIEVAKELVEKVDGFCVSNMDEALELRQAGIENPLLILGVIPARYCQLAQSLNISLTVSSLDWLKEVQTQEMDLKGLTVHLKLDTGMGRLGFRTQEDLLEAITILEEMGISIEGVYTHFATADEENQEQFKRQLTIFNDFLSVFSQLPRWVHTSNSAASIWHQESIFNMVRLGNILYGLNPSGWTLDLPYDIKPSLSLETEIVHVKEVEVGATIGYGASYKSKDKEVIATLPIGYADGLIRRMQGFNVLVDGYFCPIVGRVSMDQITIRLPDYYQLGTKVTLIGENTGSIIAVQDWADYLGTINYEVVCLLSDRILRKYKEK